MPEKSEILTNFRNQFSASSVLAIVMSVFFGPTVVAEEIEVGGKLLLTRGISSVEGIAGGGLVPWALIAGNETDRGIGGTAHATKVILPDFELFSYGGAVGFYDRFELSLTRQEFDTGKTGPLLGLEKGFTFEQDVIAAKVRLFGDAVYDQDTWLPQVSLGLVHKDAAHSSLLNALGAESDSGTEEYVTATKLILSESMMLGGALRYTDANQNGLLGFGGETDAQLMPELSLGYMLSKRLIVGGEYRAKPDNLAFAKEDDWIDLFAAFAVNDNVTFSAAYVDLGSIATFEDQRGVYVSLQLGF